MAQTRDQILAKIESMLGDVCETLDQEIDRLLKSGALDLESADDNFIIPKMLLVASLKYAAAQYEPPAHNKRLTRQQRNLERM